MIDGIYFKLILITGLEIVLLDARKEMKESKPLEEKILRKKT